MEKPHKVNQLTREVIAKIRMENRQLSDLTRKADELRQELGNEQSIRQRLEKENQELRASEEPGQEVLDQLSGLKAIIEGQVADLQLQILDTHNSESQEETARQVLKSNADLKRRFDETDIQLQECLQSLEVVHRLTEMLEAENGLELENQKFQEIAVELARATSSHDPSFCNMIQGLEFNELPVKICKSLESKLREMLPQARETTDLFRLLGQAKSAELIDQDGLSLAHSIRVQRNKFVHGQIHPDTKRARVLFILLAASLLWPEYLPEDPGAGLKLAA